VKGRLGLLTMNRFDPSAGAKRSMWTKQKTAVGGALSEKIHIFETAKDCFHDESCNRRVETGTSLIG
jgi:hypothetical protein